MIFGSFVNLKAFTQSVVTPLSRMSFSSTCYGLRKFKFLRKFPSGDIDNFDVNLDKIKILDVDSVKLISSDPKLISGKETTYDSNTVCGIL